MGHIPSVDNTKDMNIMTFEETIHNDSNNIICFPKEYTEYRYILKTKGTNPIIVIGVNPSTANSNELDNTLKRVLSISKYNGYDSFIMCNLYPQRATNPNDLEDNINESLHKENLEAFEWALKQTSNPVVWAAWGNLIEKRNYLKNCLKDLIVVSKKYNVKWVIVEETAKGHPHHPLGLKTTDFDKFDIDKYVLDTGL